MRVIAGEFRGAPLAAPPGRHTRPITDRVKESLFNILGHHFQTPGLLPDLAVLDLFAGSGALGIECLSRGAHSCLFVERNRPALRVLRANLEKLHITHLASVSVENAWTMRIPPAATNGYGLMFIDPPYRDAIDPLRVLNLLERLTPRLTPKGVVVFRCPTATGFSTESLRSLKPIDDRTFGQMRLLLMRRAIPDISQHDPNRGRGDPQT